MYHDELNARSASRGRQALVVEASRRLQPTTECFSIHPELQGSRRPPRLIIGGYMRGEGHHARLGALVLLVLFVGAGISHIALTASATRLRTHSLPTGAQNCNPASWMGYDGQICGGCSALVNVQDNGGTCEEYCSRQGLSCSDSWDDTTGEQCSMNAPRRGCSYQWTNVDAICECTPGALADRCS